MQQDRVALEPLHIDVPALHPLRIHCVREAGVPGANDLDFSGWRCRQVDRPLEMLLRGSPVAGYLAADADRVTFSSKQRSFLNSYFSLAEAELSLQVGERKGNKNRSVSQFPLCRLLQVPVLQSL